MPIAMFHDAKREDAYEALQRWRRDNPHGLLLNVKSDDTAVPRRTDCKHRGDTYWSNRDDLRRTSCPWRFRCLTAQLRFMQDGLCYG